MCLYEQFLPYKSNILKAKHDGSYFADDIFKSIYLNDNLTISKEIALW